MKLKFILLPFHGKVSQCQHRGYLFHCQFQNTIGLGSFHKKKKRRRPSTHYCTLHLKHCETSLACVPNILLVRGRGRVRVESCRYVALIKRLLITPDTTRRHVARDRSHDVCLRFNDHFHVL